MTDRNGKPIRLSDYRGKTVVLDFWATWCGVCRVSLIHEAEFAKQYESRGIVVLAVDVWDTPNAMRNWLPDQNWLPANPQDGGPIFAVDPSSVDKGIARVQYGVGGLPTLYIIGKDGRVVGTVAGYDSGNKRLEATLKDAGV